MPIEQAFIISKVERIRKSLKKIRSKLQLTDDQLIHSDDDLAVLERNFQLMVDYAIDINHHFIKEGGFGIPDDLQSTFTSLGDHSVLFVEFASKIDEYIKQILLNLK